MGVAAPLRRHLTGFQRSLAVEILRDALAGDTPRPTLPLTSERWGEGDEAERVDHLLGHGFADTG